MKKTILQILKEFWLPVIGSVVWGYFKTKNLNDDASYGLVYLENFGVSFFLMSWLLGQFNRVRKQQKVESYFELLTKRLEDIIAKFESNTKQVINNVTGGDSIAYFVVTNISADKETGVLTLVVHGENGVYDLAGTYLDFDEIFKNPKIEYKHIPFSFGNVPPHSARSFTTIKLNKERGVYINFFFTARRGLYNQGLRMQFVDGEWKVAIHVTDMDKVLFKQIPDDFPENEYDKNEIERWRKGEE